MGIRNALEYRHLGEGGAELMLESVERSVYNEGDVVNDVPD